MTVSDAIRRRFTMSTIADVFGARVVVAVIAVFTLSQGWPAVAMADEPANAVSPADLTNGTLLRPLPGGFT